MKYLVLLVCIWLPIFTSGQERKLKAIQPGLSVLMTFEIRLNPADTIFNQYDFSYFPVKGFPLYTADPSIHFYTISERDSIVKRMDDLFFEK